MRVWRILRSEFAKQPLSGQGAADFGGRWNSVGVRIAYTSTSRPLAVLEALVHSPLRRIPADAALLPIDIPDDSISEAETLPHGWNDIDETPQARRIGDRWIESGRSLALLVPSAVLPAEKNILINPSHARFADIRMGEPEPRAFDRRLLGWETG